MTDQERIADLERRVAVLEERLERGSILHGIVWTSVFGVLWPQAHSHGDDVPDVADALKQIDSLRDKLPPSDPIRTGTTLQ
jgi:hypothetical protein